MKPWGALSGHLNETAWQLLLTAAYDAGGGPDYVVREPYDWDPTHLHVDLEKWP